MRTIFTASTKWHWIVSFIALLAGACTSIPVAPAGTPASSGFKLGDRIVLVSDLDLRDGESGGKSSYSNSRFLLLNYDRSQTLHPKPYCSLNFAANHTVLPANTLLTISSRQIEAGERLDKLGNKYKFSEVHLFAFSDDRHIKAVVVCNPEEVYHFGLWSNKESSGRMMTIEEIKEILKDFVVFTSAS